MTNPEDDPIGTVRVHPGTDSSDPRAFRRIKVATTEHPPYNGEGWFTLTIDDHHADTGGNLYTNAEQNDLWPVQPFTEVARILGHPEPDNGGWEPVHGLIDSRERKPVPVPVEDAQGVRYHDDEPVPAAPSTVDRSAREPEDDARTRIQDVLHREGCEDHRDPGRCWEEAGLIVAALPELAENEKLRAERDTLSGMLRRMARRASEWRGACRFVEREYAKAAAKRTRPHVGAHVEVKPSNGKPFLGTVIIDDRTHLWVSPDNAPAVAGRYLPEQLAVIT